MLIDEIKKRIIQAMKDKDTVTKSILRVALGELQTEQARAGEITEAKEFQLIRKMVKSNEETLALTKEAQARQILEKELAILGQMLPQTLSVQQIIEALGPVTEQIKSANNDGQAIGLAMKQLKSTGALVDGKEVAATVKQLRSE